jgi:autotransporter-associated beta strand protein
MKISILIALVVGLAGVDKCVAAITLNQVDTFTGSLDNWTDGHSGSNVLDVGTGGPNGTGDGYLQVSSGSFGGQARMITFDQSQWVGNYTTAGVGVISMELKNFGTTTLPIRITIRDGTLESVPGYSSTTPFMLPADGNWHLATFSVTASAMTAVGTGAPAFATELTSIADFRLLSSAAPAIMGDSINARIGVDDITALAPPPTAWSGASSTSWSATGNWTGAVPGVITGTTNSNTATFNQSATNSPLTIDAGRNLQNLTFDTASVGSLTLGTAAGQSLLLTAAGTTQTTSTVANAQTINAPLVLEGNYTFTSGASSSTAKLAFGGGITPGPTTGTTTLTLNGANTGANTITGALANHTTGLLAVTKSGGGVWILSGANTYSGGTSVTNGTLTVGSNGTGTLGAGALAIASPGIVNVNNTFAVGGLSGTGQLNVAASKILSVNQTGTGTFSGTLSLAASSGVTVNSGTVQLNVASASTLGIGDTATVAAGATLQLAGSVSALSDSKSGNLANVFTQGTGSTSGGALSITGATSQTVGTLSGASSANGGATIYAGNTTVGDGTHVAKLTAKQILQNTLTINASSTVTIAPSASGTMAVATASGATAAAGVSLTPADSSSDPFSAIQNAISSGAISSATGQGLENRVAAIERLATTDPALDVSLLESRVLAALSSSSILPSADSSPMADPDSGMLAMDCGTLGWASSGAIAAFAPGADFGGSPAAVPEPSTLLLATLGGIGLALVARRRTNRAIR